MRKITPGYAKFKAWRKKKHKKKFMCTGCKWYDLFQFPWDERKWRACSNGKANEKTCFEPDRIKKNKGRSK